MSKSSKRRRQSAPQPNTNPAPASAPIRPQRPASPRPRKAAAQSPLVRYRTLIYAAVGALGLAVLAFVFLQSASGKSYECDSQLQPSAGQTANPEALGFTTDDMGQGHVSGGAIRYAYCPPASGSHYSGSRGPIRSAVYPASSEQAPGGWVHNLEHGAIVVLYRCPEGTLDTEGCATSAEMTQMRAWFDAAPVVNGCPKQAIVARFDDMATRFAVLSWNRALLVDAFDLTQASAFAQQWTDVTAPPAEIPVCS